MTDYITLSSLDLSLSAILVVLNALLSLRLGLGLERRLLMASVRMVVQLLLIGLLLQWLFAQASPLLTLGIALIMVGFAGYEILARQDHRIRGLWGYGLGTSTMLAAACLITLFTLSTQISPDPWYDPRYAIPLLGMILGNTMTGIALGLNTLTGDMVLRRTEIESRLALGETRVQALRPLAIRALRTAWLPTINVMAATGIVALPGMMTGQILGGVPPMDAVKYQILILFLVAGSTGLGSLAAVWGAIWRLTDSRHRLRLERLR